MQGQIRQGDVLLVPVEGVLRPANAQAKIEVILALGEATGHAHRLKAPVIYEWEIAGQRYVQVQGDTPGTLTHEEHDPSPAPVVAPNVTYRVVQQREWDLFGQWRKVVD